VASKLPAEASLDVYQKAAPGSPEAQAYAAARSAAGPEVLNATLVIPIILTVAFIGLYFYMKGRQKPQLVAKTV
jgi:hypothetical protein